jgi:tRNA-specific 2-thiouridylase
MTQEQLASTLFPLGSMTKSQVRAIASEKGFASAGKRESQDICFVPDGDYAGFIERRIGAKMKNGRFIDTVGNDLGEHKGIYRYTVGQRRGIGIPGAHPMYVCAVRPESNSVVVGTEDKLYSNDIVARNINLIPVETIDAPLRVTAKIRYKQPEQQATVWQPDADTLRVEFDKPQRAITRGQAVVLYDGDTVIGGGTIV